MPEGNAFHDSEKVIDMEHTSTLTVSLEYTAEMMGSGDMPVLATPALVALMENAAMMACRPLCGEGQTTVGGSIQVQHLKPSPLGAAVEATAHVTQHEGRKVEFTIEARQGEVVIGTASHTRFIVDRERFLSKLREG